MQNAKRKITLKQSMMLQVRLLLKLSRRDKINYLEACEKYSPALMKRIDAKYSVQ